MFFGYFWGAGPRWDILFTEVPIRCVPPQMGFAHLGFPGSLSGMENTIQEVCGWVWTHEKARRVTPIEENYLKDHGVRLGIPV